MTTPQLFLLQNQDSVSNQIQLAGYTALTLLHVTLICLKLKENLCDTKFTNLNVALEHYFTFFEEISQNKSDKNWNMPSKKEYVYLE